MNYILTGFQGSGKTSCGKRLAERLQMPFIDTDELLLQRACCNTLRELHLHIGEERFREEELAALQAHSWSGSCIMALGGGFLATKEAREYIMELGSIIYLYLPISHLRADSTASVLQKMTLDELYELRHPIYTQSSQYLIDITHLTLERTVEEIIAKVMHGKQ